MKSSLGQLKKYLLLLLAGVALISAADYLGFFEGMKNHVYDLCFRLRGAVEPDRRVLIAAVDEQTLRRLGRWPLRRAHYARLLSQLSQASVVGFDIIMAEPAEDDALLARAVAQHDRVVFPLYIENTPFEVSPPSLISACPAGHVHMEPDIDGVIRRAYHTLYFAGRRLPSFTSVIYEKLTGVALPRQPRPAGSGDPTAPASIVQMDARQINYYGPPGTFPRIPLADIAEGKYPPDFFKNRIVLVGVTSAGLDDEVLTPFSQQRNRMSGIETQANILANLLDHRLIIDIPAALILALSLLLALPFLFFFIKNNGRRTLLVWFLGIAAAFLGSFLVFVAGGFWFNPLLFALFLSFLFLVAYLFKLEEAGRLLGVAKEEWEDAFNTINDAIVVMDRDGRAIRTNKVAGTMLNDELRGIISSRRLPREAIESLEAQEEILAPLTGHHFEIKSLPRYDSRRQCTGSVHIIRNITRRKKLETEQNLLQRQLMQAQKMESIGRLAGGVAHDFNNILTAIIGYSEIDLIIVPPENPVHHHIKVVHDSALKAAALIRQLLAVSRRQVMEITVLNLKESVAGMANILVRTIGEDVTLCLRTETTVRNILADPVHIEQIIMNLAVNARDAMPGGGTLTIETADIHFDESYAHQHEGMAPGSYVMLAMADTGSGMPAEVQEHIFEPFYTTKKPGEGTGLGLSTVYGIIRQMGGHICLTSELDKGTVFKIYLPACREEVETRTATDTTALARGTEGILVVEDDLAIRNLIAEILQPLGYQVRLAGSGTEALGIAETAGRSFDLLLTDVVMPGMNGEELARRLQEQYPHIKVIFMSGHSEETVIQHGIEQQGVAFLRKPILPGRLVAKLREVLDG